MIVANSWDIWYCLYVILQCQYTLLQIYEDLLSTPNKKGMVNFMKRILLIATGGTIASKRSDAGLKPLISSDELLSYVPSARDFC